MCINDTDCHFVESWRLFANITENGGVTARIQSKNTIPHAAERLIGKYTHTAEDITRLMLNLNLDKVIKVCSYKISITAGIYDIKDANNRVILQRQTEPYPRDTYASIYSTRNTERRGRACRA